MVSQFELFNLGILEWIIHVIQLYPLIGNMPLCVDVRVCDYVLEGRKNLITPCLNR